jgi:signal transduction histidine kinase
VKHTVALMEDLLREAREMDARTLPGPSPRRAGQAQLLDLNDAIHHCVGLYSTVLQAASCLLTVYCDENLVGPWSRAAIYQILSNLIVNATKYAPGKPIEVHATRDAKAVIIIVADRGPGFSVEEQGRVFERFRRAPRAGAPEGFGLGLWIVQRAAERLGATVRLVSAPGEGALFLIEIPCEGR